MARIISLHSFRGGTGKSNTTANIAAVMALNGKLVGIIDTDIQSPGIHVLFGLKEGKMAYCLNDFLWGNCEIGQAAYDVTENLGKKCKGRLFLIPSSIKAGDIARVLHDGYDVGMLNDGYQSLIQDLNLDVLLIDTHPGLNEETLLSIALSDILLVILRPDHQDYQGTGVTVEVARELEVPQMKLIVNKAPSIFDHAEIKTRVERAYNHQVAEIIPHSEEMMALGSEDLFVLRHPGHPVTKLYTKIAESLVL